MEYLFEVVSFLCVFVVSAGESVMYWMLFNSFLLSVAFHIETSSLICTANQIIGSCMSGNIGLKWVKMFGVMSIIYLCFNFHYIWHKYLQRRIHNPVKHLRWGFSRKYLTGFRKKLLLRCLKGFWIRLWHWFSIFTMIYFVP